MAWAFSLVCLASPCAFARWLCLPSNSSLDFHAWGQSGFSFFSSCEFDSSLSPVITLPILCSCSYQIFSEAWIACSLANLTLPLCFFVDVCLHLHLFLTSIGRTLWFSTLFCPPLCYSLSLKSGIGYLFTFFAFTSCICLLALPFSPSGSTQGLTPLLSGWARACVANIRLWRKARSQRALQRVLPLSFYSLLGKFIWLRGSVDCSGKKP